MIIVYIFQQVTNVEQKLNQKSAICSLIAQWSTNNVHKRNESRAETPISRNISLEICTILRPARTKKPAREYCDIATSLAGSVARWFTSAEPAPGVPEHTHPGAVLLPLRRVPGMLRGPEHTLRVRHHDGGAPVKASRRSRCLSCHTLLLFVSEREPFSPDRASFPEDAFLSGWLSRDRS